jgi:ATP-dependent DNA helicase RecG
MNLTEFVARVETWEDIHTEFKERSIAADDLAASLVAFANTDGGQLIFGVNNQKQLIGINDPDRLMQLVDNVAFNNCDPPITVVQETVRDEQGRVVVVVNVPKRDQRPSRTQRGVYFVRTTSGRRQASRQELLRLFQATESLFYDETPVFRADMTDLDEQAIARLLQDVQAYGVDIAGMPRERLLRNWSLIQEVNGEMHPTVAGTLFLSRHPQQLIPYVYISALQIPGTDLADAPHDQKRIEGPMRQMLEDSMRFLEIHLRRHHKIKGLEPEAKLELPIEVLREALVNALAHRDYTIVSPIRVIVFADRLEIHTPGQLPNGVTIDSIRLGVHVLRNPSIYNIFLKLGLVTDAGSGVPRMIRLIRQATNQEPDFRIVGHEFIVALPRSSQLQQR